AQIHQHTPDGDRLVDDFAQLDDFAAFSAESAIIGLWRCVEIYRKTAIRIASGQRAATRAFRHKEFQIRDWGFRSNEFTRGKARATPAPSSASSRPPPGQPDRAAVD